MQSGLFKSFRNHAPTTQPPAHLLIPLYNGSDYILTALRSALKQSWKNLRIMIVDDGSTDNCSRKVLDFLHEEDLATQNRVTIHVELENHGVSRTRSYLFDWSRRVNPDAYIFWLDADDRYTDRHFIKNVMRQMQKSQADICLYNFSVKFEYEIQLVNAAVLQDSFRQITSILHAISEFPDQCIHPLQLQNILEYTSLGWTKCYAPSIQLPRAKDCPYEDFVYMAALLRANRITVMQPEYKPVEHLRRSGAIRGQRQHDTFAEHIPEQLIEFFDTVLADSKDLDDKLIRIYMAAKFVSHTFGRYEPMLKKFIEEKTWPDIDNTTLEIYQKRRAEIEETINEIFEEHQCTQTRDLSINRCVA